MSNSAFARTERSAGSLGCSPVVMLRLLSMAEDRGTPLIVDEPEQLLLPLDWLRSVPQPQAPEPPRPTERADPTQWGARIALAAFEIMLGNRPANQFARIVDSKTLQVLALNTSKLHIERKRLRNVMPTRPRVTSIRCFQPHKDAAEITAVVHDGVRFRAVAMRLSYRSGQWVATAFEMA